MPYPNERDSAQLSLTFRDRSNEKSTSAIYVPFDVPIEDVGGDGIPDNALVVAYVNAVDALTDGVIDQYASSQVIRGLTLSQGAGQREHKFLVRYADDVTLERFTFTIPTRKVTLEPPVGTDRYDITAAPFAGFVTAFEALAVSPRGNTVTVTDIVLAGRNI